MDQQMNDVFQIDRILIEKIKIACRQKFICRQVIFLFPVSNIKVEFYHISESIVVRIYFSVKTDMLTSDRK